MYSLALLAAALATAFAAPTSQNVEARQYPGTDPTCDQPTEYKNVTVSPRFSGPMQMAMVGPVTSNPEDPGTLSKIYTQTEGVTITIGASLGLDFPKAVGTTGIGLSIDGSYAWSYSDTTGYSDSVSCPTGSPNAYTCSAETETHFVHVTGTAEVVETGSCYNSGQVDKSTPFNFTAPVVLQSDPKTGSSNADSTFYACICGSSPNQTELSNFKKCTGPC
jgi:hypothetical protein